MWPYNSYIIGVYTDGLCDFVCKAEKRSQGSLLLHFGRLITTPLLSLLTTPALTVVVNLPRYVFLLSVSNITNPCFLHHPGY